MKRLTVTAMARKYGGVLLAAALAFGQFSPTVYAAQTAAEENVVFDAEVPEEAAEAFSDAETFVEEAPVTSYQIEDRDAGASAKPGCTFAGWYVDKGWNYKKNTQIYGSRVTKFALKDEVHLIAKWAPVR